MDFFLRVEMGFNFKHFDRYLFDLLAIESIQGNNVLLKPFGYCERLECFNLFVVYGVNLVEIYI